MDTEIIELEEDLDITEDTNENSETDALLTEVENGPESLDVDGDEKADYVNLRRKKLSTDGTLPTTIEDDYLYAGFTSPESRIPKMSRRKLEMGSERMISDDDLYLAATLVSDAMEGRTTEFKTQRKYVRSYNLYKSWPFRFLLYLTIVLDVFLVVFEQPAVYEMSLDYWITIPVECLCLLYFVIRTIHHAHWRRKELFFKDKKNKFVIFIIIFTIIDIIIYVSMKMASFEGPTIRYSRCLRAFLTVNFSDGREIRRAWRNMRRTIRQISHMIALYFFFVSVFALVAYELFRDQHDIVYPNDEPYFKEYTDSFWDLFVLITTSNHPDVILPASEKSSFYSIFFFVYVLLCFYILLNAFLAVAYHSYTENMKNEIKRSSRAKKKKLTQAFDVIKVNYKGSEMVTYSTWKRLMKLANSRLNKNQIDLLMLILDMNRTGHIGRREFMNVADLLNVPLSEVKDRVTWLELRFPNMYNSLPSDILKLFVNSVFFKLLYDAIIVLHVVLIAFVVPNVNIPFYCLFVSEILLKLYTYGPSRYMRNMGNWFDVFVTACSTSFVFSDIEDNSALQAFNVVNIVRTFRIFRILRLLVHIQRFQVVTSTIYNIFLSILMYCVIIFMVFYVFALSGMEIYQGRIHNYGYENVTNEEHMYCGDVRLKGTDFYESRYCSMNFNDFVSSMVLLATLLFQNNWHTEGYVKVTSKWTRLFFGAFYTCVVSVMMNIVTAFIVDMFMYEYTIQMQGKVDSAVEKKIKELGLGINSDTDLDISEPMSDNQLQELMQKEGKDINILQHSLKNKSLFGERIRKAENRLTRFGTFVRNRRASIGPSLSRFDGIRFHIKKTGWTKIEVLLQQLYEVEGDDEDIDVTLNFNETRSYDKARSIMN